MTIALRPLVVIMIAGLAVCVIALAGWQGGYRLNETPSYPLGLWRIEPIARPVAVGDRVFVCPPQTENFALAAERGYVRRGLCPGWLSPLIKTVAAVAGQRIDIAASVSIDGRLLDHSQIHVVDAQGRALVPYGGGIVPAGFLYLHSNFAGSYDSRYFGPVPATGLLGLARPVLTFGP